MKKEAKKKLSKILADTLAFICTLIVSVTLVALIIKLAIIVWTKYIF